MPYIETEARDELIGDTANRGPETPGELNYLLTVLVDQYLCDNHLCYSTINEVIGVLECAKLELYRRIAAPYEEQKRFDNGDVYQSV